MEMTIHCSFFSPSYIAAKLMTTKLNLSFTSMKPRLLGHSYAPDFPWG